MTDNTSEPDELFNIESNENLLQLYIFTTVKPEFNDS